MIRTPIEALAPGGAFVRRRQAGLTLVELMVALVIGLVVAAAAVAALLVARNGFTTVDSTAQLRENARFTSDLIQRLAVQAGFEDVAGRGFSIVPPDEKPPAIQGFDDAILAVDTDPAGLANGSRSSGCAVTDTSCLNGSDALVIRFWGTSPGADPSVADGSMINCAGIGEPEGTELSTSVFHIIRSASGEPTLACTYRDPSSGDWKTMALVPGVEAMQVLYGVDNVTPGAAPSGATDSVPDRYLRASQLVVSGDSAATLDNWRRVRSLRIGLLFRGPVGGAQDRDIDVTARTYDVLGNGFSVSADTKSQLIVPADGRVRQAMVFNVHLRNP
ncbi:MAG TPA: PilW family protein [Burkholderiaceae bacterium]|nr:PilW family protein [Burkholderiaceae bacterium]